MKINKFGNSLSETIYKGIHGTKSISKAQFTQEDIDNLIFTVAKINQLDINATNITSDISVIGYQVPEFVKDLVLPYVSLTGSRTETRLVEFEVEDLPKGRVLTRMEMFTVSAAIYGCQRATVSMVDLPELIATAVPLSSINDVLAVDDEYVSQIFKIGAFPIIPTLPFIKKEYSAMGYDFAVEEWVISILGSFKK
jgi:hypothetical protein